MAGTEKTINRSVEEWRVYFKSNAPESLDELRQYFRTKLVAYADEKGVKVDKNGGSIMNLPLPLRKEWFRRRYPDGRIVVELISTIGDNISVRAVKCSLYENASDAHPLSTGLGEAYRSKNPEEDAIPAYRSAESAAIRDALINAGFTFSEEFSIEPPADRVKLKAEVEAVKQSRLEKEKTAKAAHAEKVKGTGNFDITALAS